MSKDRLFLLKPDFKDKGELYFCPGCSLVEGVLSYYPHLRGELEISYVDFSRPRPAIVRLLGEENQSAPVLVLARKSEAEETPGYTVREYNGRYFVAEPWEVAYYLAARYGVARPHYLSDFLR